MSLSYRIFETGLGWAGVVGTADRVSGALLPEKSAESVRTHIERRWPHARPGPELDWAADRIRGLIDGGDDDLRDLELDMSAIEPFEQQVYALARAVGPGETTTYGDIARALGDLSQSQAVGKALGRNPFAPIIPCHRVVAAGQKLGGFSASGGRSLKLRMLASEQRWSKDDLFGQSA
jgi:methylated-DNA-[protein]-cysteine S-methyltransferase